MTTTRSHLGKTLRRDLLKVVWTTELGEQDSLALWVGDLDGWPDALPPASIDRMELGGDTKAVLLAAAAMFLWALLLGVWKYRQMVTDPQGLAHPYVDTAHRAALLYSFALLLVATFVELSGWSALVDLLAAGAMTFYFFAAVAGYALHGWRRDTTNQFHPPTRGLRPFMTTLIAAEIGGWLVLIAGFVDGQIL